MLGTFLAALDRAVVSSAIRTDTDDTDDTDDEWDDLRHARTDAPVDTDPRRRRRG